MHESTSNKIKLGLLGRNISHSRSPSIYKGLLGNILEYQLFDIEEEHNIPTLDYFFNDVQGLSITAPYKRHFIDHIKQDKISSILRSTNCIRRIGTSKFEGTLTDYPAFCEIYDSKIESKRKGKVAILGSGSMSLMVQLALAERSIPFIIYSRNAGTLAEDVSLLDSGCDVIINCCGREFVFNGKVAKSSIFFDFNYEHIHRDLLTQVDEIHYMDGEELLLRQAKHALNFWQIPYK